MQSLPINPSQAGREFRAVFFMMCSSEVACNMLKNLVLQGSCRTSSSQIKNFARFLIWVFNLLRRYLLRQSSSVPGQCHCPLISANLFHASRRGVSCHVLYGGQHRHNKNRDEDSLSDKGMICYYADRAWWLVG